MEASFRTHIRGIILQNADNWKLSNCMCIKNGNYADNVDIYNLKIMKWTTLNMKDKRI